LGANVYGNYYPSPALSVVNYASTVFAAILYLFVFSKFYRTARNDGSPKLGKEAAPVLETA